MRCVGFVKWFGVLLLLDSLVFKASAAHRRCRFSNEGCSEDTDCCSQSCEQRHSGADKRCSKSEILSPCYADYQCEDGLQCGRKYKCCAPYWHICYSAEECCDIEHACTYHSGFTYKMCLFPASSAFKSKINIQILVILMFITQSVILIL